MEKDGVIKGYYAYINPASLNLDYMVITSVKAKYGKNYHVELGNKLAQILGVWGVYFVLGGYDFIVMSRYKTREEFMENS
ncbi:Lrp/AsnC family transcriptional regulator [Sulfolobus sp. S-194]|uniref:Lrp/AsnC family transcriptional regulator n=1 Tax=Sulfolobus sp. S-194 TaxID=2512240 RepID=UPI00257033A2|nr:Lrp/AsnC family transcriptional regulator [Sulfolobus sp. S-194]